MKTTVVVATYGSDVWEARGDRAAEAVQGALVLRVHHPDRTLAQVRNAGLVQVHTERVCFLDGDDGLEPGYFDRDLRADVTVTPLDGVFPVSGNHPHECGPICLLAGNYIHVGAIASTGLLVGLGGFREHPIYEDWDLWLRCMFAGATFINSPGPSYLTHQHGAGSRNTSLTTTQRRQVRADILRTAREGAQP